MSKTFLRITNEDLIIALAYIAAVCSYLAWQDAQKAKHRAAGAQAQLTAHRATVETDDELEDIDAEEVREAVEEDLDDEGDE